jgi:hypothetical protein
MKIIIAICLLATIGLVGSPSSAIADQPAASTHFAFDALEIDPHIGDVCYAVTHADVDDDGDADIVAISESAAVWYENPSWQKHVMIEDALPRDHVCIAAGDIDRDGKVDFAIGSGWPQNGGTLSWIERGEQPSEPWVVHAIGAEPWTHRMRFGNVLGRETPQLVVSPLNGPNGQGARLLAFAIPQDPAADDWKPVVVDATLHRMHNHLHVDQPQAQADATLTASQEGIQLLVQGSNGGFQRTPVAEGADGGEPTSNGAGEIKLGSLGDRRPILATIEPMHGNQVVVYLINDLKEFQVRKRVVLDDSFNQGHALAVVDLDNDGIDEVVAAFRQPREQSPPGPGIIIYRATDESATDWEAIPLDLEAMACEDLICHDFDGDGLVDIAAGGRASHNVKLYRNQTKTK